MSRINVILLASAYARLCITRTQYVRVVYSKSKSEISWLLKKESIERCTALNYHLSLMFATCTCN